MASALTHAEWIADALARHEIALLRYATRLFGDHERARDAVQETFLQLCQAERSRVEDHLRAWLFRVCRNRLLDMRRKEQRMQHLSLVTEQSLASEAPSPSAITEARERASRVLELIDTLSDKQKETVYLRFASGLSYKEIAEVTGHSVSNVGVMIHTAVKKIRQDVVAAGTGTKAAGGAR